ncbi:MAG: hypothetical protein N3J91_07990, partial [Verrucomicrobiae bacterium]|nr:hypothetical protein [Verrucomicrobiae bacterium]
MAKAAFCSGAFWLAAVLAVWGQSPLTINGVTDKSTYNNSVTFRVPSEAGYTYQVLFNNVPIPTDVDMVVTNMDYHELRVSRTNITTQATTNRLVRFIVLSTQRGSPEKGLPMWTPLPPIPSTAAECAGARLELCLPAVYPQGLPIPVIARVTDSGDRVRRVNGRAQAEGFETTPLQIIRGHGSVLLPPVLQSGLFTYSPRLAGLAATQTVQIEAGTVWTPFSGSITGVVTWPENSRIHLTGHVSISSNATLTVGAGTVIRMNPLVNITNNGQIYLNGTAERPIVLMATNVVWPEVPAGAWGGFILRGTNAQLTANYAIMAGGGGATSFNFSPGASHRSEQAVLLVHSGARAYLTNCAIINTAGQVGNGYSSTLVWERCHFQRAITGGEYSGGCSLLINQSAVFEFPIDDGVVDANIADADYDGIYFTEGTYVLQNSLFGFAKDDAIDSGSGGAGTVLVTNCWVESALHEAHAWSGGGRQTWSYDTVLINSGQGIECGWSTGDNSPLCFAERLLTTANGVGARVGDNYDWSYNGFLRLTNSLILYNYRDIFLKTWNGVGSGLNALSWEDRLSQVDFRSNYVTTVDARFPGNVAWQPAEHAALLAGFMTPPPHAPVGVGLALRTNRMALASLFNGVPVRLSSFTTNPVSVSYAWVSGGADRATGRVTFFPGETVKYIFPHDFDLASLASVELQLRQAENAEITGLAVLTATGTVPRPQITLAVVTNTYSAWRLTEGVFVQLSSPSAMPVALGYQFTGSNRVVQAGTVVVPPNTLRAQLLLTNASPFDYDFLELSVGQAENATLGGITNVVFAYTTVPLRLGLAAEGPLAIAQFTNGVMVTLNAPAVQGVSVDFEILGNRVGRTNGTLAFAAGALSAVLQAPTVPVAGNDFLLVTLSR